MPKQSIILNNSDMKEIKTAVKKEFGSSGVRIFSGLYDEEYLTNLTGSQRAEEFDKIKKRDSQVQMLLKARKNPIISANWHVDTKGEEDTHIFHKDFIEKELFSRCEMSFTDFLEEALSMIEFGHSVFERTHEIVGSIKVNGVTQRDYVGLKNLSWRSPKTIERWNLSKQGRIISVTQMADGDLDANVDIPHENLYIFTLNKLGANYEGVSDLRPCYGNSLRKDIYLKILAMGLERSSLGVPIGTVPTNKQGTNEASDFEAALRLFSSHQQSAFVKSEGWEVDFKTMSFDAEKLVEAIKYEDLQMSKAFMANHLELGTGGTGGAYALGTDMSDQFLSIIQNDASIIAAQLNILIRELIDINFGKQDVYPEMKVTGINDKVGKEFSEILNSLVEKKIVTANAELEHFVRDQYKLPMINDEDLEGVNREIKPQQAAFSEVRLAKTGKGIASLIEDQTKLLKIELDEQVIESISKMSKSIEKNAKKEKLAKVVQSIEFKDKTKLKQIVKSRVEKIKELSLNQARKEVPVSIRLDLNKEDKKLIKSVNEIISIESSLVVGSIIEDIEKSANFAVVTAMSETTDAAIIADKASQSMLDKKDKILQASASVVASKAVNLVRDSYFNNNSSIYSEIQAFQFRNDNPSSPICQDLNGRIFRKNDPESDKYRAPLHHNAVLSDTLITTENGQKPIQNVVVGEKVLTHKGNYCEVYDVMSRFEDKHYFELTLDNGKTIDITGEHPVLTGRGWQRVDQLLIEDDIVCVENIKNG